MLLFRREGRRRRPAVSAGRERSGGKDREEGGVLLYGRNGGGSNSWEAGEGIGVLIPTNRGQTNGPKKSIGFRSIPSPNQAYE
jgi:hypothetical protein